MTITQAREETSAVYRLSPADQAVADARIGRVAWLADADHEVVAVLPAGLAHAALEALEDAEDIAIAREALARRAAGERSISMKQLMAEIDAQEAAA
ncbi:MAG: hypothetical protein ACRDPW_11275 [Mycobacteriales bacterium]